MNRTVPVSVIIPTYNEEIHLAACLASVAGWARESNVAAAEVVYTKEVRAVVEAGEDKPHSQLAVVDITPEYLKVARPVASQRAALAAVRSAKLLEAPAK